MSVTCTTMLDYSKLVAPTEHGRILIMPDPDQCVAALRANAETLRTADAPILDMTIAEWRRRTREAILGSDDMPVVVIGHQPAFVHPGVWAKHIVAARLANAVGGMAVNLVVDNDAPKSTTVAIPTVSQGHTTCRSIRFADLQVGYAFEQLARQSSADTARFEEATREALGHRYDRSQMPTFFRAFHGATNADDWVDQAVTARRAVEARFGVAVDDQRVSRVWCGPLLIDMLVNIERFAASYNGALAGYRKEHGIRGDQRPIPNLASGNRRKEMPVWVYRPHEPRRRLFVERANDELRLFADRQEIGSVPAGGWSCSDHFAGLVGGLEDWRLRPRALTLTIWARLLLADLFIHGIGGAKYDRITDAIIADYYALEPPHMACVSATLMMDFPRSETTEATISELGVAWRDLNYNPQRNLASGADLDPLVEQRAVAVNRAMGLRCSDASNRRARRAAFARIREANAALLAARPDEVSALRLRLDRSKDDLRRNLVARGREYFFGLYDDAALGVLLHALPAERDFRV